MSYFKIIEDERGVGGFLCPPGHPNHHYWVSERAGNHKEVGFMSLDAALICEWVPEATKTEIRKIVESSTLVESEDWVRMVYSYFRNCYSPDGVDRNTSNAIIPPKDGTRPQPNARHLGYLMVRSYFPEHELRVDLLSDSSGYGTRRCSKCGQTLQYEAGVDAWAEAITAKKECPKGGEHEPSPSI